jgi:glyoxylase-like metal-dependent hydrolase (beta-lactamase superfamily II)
MDRPEGISRRSFLAATSCFGAAYAVAHLLPLPALAQSVAQDPRVAAAPLADKGFASVRKIGNGVYANVADLSKGLQSMSNGGFLVGRDSAFLIEGFRSPTGAAFQMEALRMVTQVPVLAALDTHYHFDHSLGNAVYGAHDIPVWAHARTASRITESYGPLQGADRAAFLSGFEKRVHDARSDAARQHAESDLRAAGGLFDFCNSTLLALPSRPLDPAKLPVTVDLGGLSAVVESHPGHSGTDLIVSVPAQNIVFTGDLLFNGFYPVTFDASISAWRKTLAHFAAMGKDTLFVPGHGPVCGQEGVALLGAIFDDLADYAGKTYKAGMPVGESVERYTVPERFKGQYIYAWGFTIGPTITKLYEEWSSK